MADRKKRAERHCSICHGDTSYTIRDPDPDSDPSSHWTPAVDIYETDLQYILTAELPGVARRDLQISVAGFRLSVKGERQVDPFCSRETCHRMETVRGPFHRTFTMPESLENSEISASLDDGVLEVRVSKSSRSRRIPVKTADPLSVR